MKTSFKRWKTVFQNNCPNIKRSLKSVITTVPSVAIGILPSFSCPSCWPAYAALLSSVGLGVYDYSEYLMPITITALAFSIAMLGWQAVHRKWFFPLILALIGSFIHLVGRFVLESDPVSYTGLAMLFIASFWSGFPKRRSAGS